MNPAFLSLLLVASSPNRGGASMDYEIIGEVTTTPTEGVLKTVQTVQVVTRGAKGKRIRHPLDRFDITRVRPANGKTHGPVLLRSPFNYDVRFYEAEMSGGGYKTTLLGTLAQQRFDVWVVDDRINRVAPGTCESGSVDCSIMATWTIENKLRDTELARSLVAEVHPEIKPIIGGFVGGSIEAMAAVNANPSAYGGFFGWQGSLYSEDPAVKSYNAPFCQFAEQALANGVVYDGSPALLIQLMERAQNAPDEPGFSFPPEVLPMPEGLTNKATLFYIMTNTLPNPSFPTPWWKTAVGTHQPPELFHIDEYQFFQLTSVANAYAAVATMRDYSCGFAGERMFNDNLHAFEGDVLMLGSEYAFGPLMKDTKKLFPSAKSVAVKVTADQGELDQIFNRKRKKLVDLPFASWAKSVFRSQT